MRLIVRIILGVVVIVAITTIVSIAAVSMGPSGGRLTQTSPLPDESTPTCPPDHICRPFETPVRVPYDQFPN